MKNLHQTDLRSEVAYLESKIDFLDAELTYINNLLMQYGFPDGTDSLKGALEEMIELEEHKDLD